MPEGQLGSRNRGKTFKKAKSSMCKDSVERILLRDLIFGDQCPRAAKRILSPRGNFLWMTNVVADCIPPGKPPLASQKRELLRFGISFWHSAKGRQFRPQMSSLDCKSCASNENES